MQKGIFLGDCEKQASAVRTADALMRLRSLVESHPGSATVLVMKKSSK
jgi:hypothetical protein